MQSVAFDLLPFHDLQVLHEDRVPSGHGSRHFAPMPAMNSSATSGYAIFVLNLKIVKWEKVEGH